MAVKYVRKAPDLDAQAATPASRAYELLSEARAETQSRRSYLNAIIAGCLFMVVLASGAQHVRAVLFAPYSATAWVAAKDQIDDPSGASGYQLVLQITAESSAMGRVEIGVSEADWAAFDLGDAVELTYAYRHQDGEKRLEVLSIAPLHAEPGAAE